VLGKCEINTPAGSRESLDFDRNIRALICTRTFDHALSTSTELDLEDGGHRFTNSPSGTEASLPANPAQLEAYFARREQRIAALFGPDDVALASRPFSL